MDSKVIAAIIIAVGFVAGIYIYVSSTPFNQCMAIQKKYENADNVMALQICVDITKNN